MRHSTSIKNLSIALEGLSRIPGAAAEAFSLRINNLLDNLLTEEEISTEQRKPSTTADDEIPF